MSQESAVRHFGNENLDQSRRTLIVELNGTNFPLPVHQVGNLDYNLWIPSFPFSANSDLAEAAIVELSELLLGIKGCKVVVTPHSTRTVPIVQQSVDRARKVKTDIYEEVITLASNSDKPGTIFRHYSNITGANKSICITAQQLALIQNICDKHKQGVVLVDDKCDLGFTLAAARGLLKEGLGWQLLGSNIPIVVLAHGVYANSEDREALLPNVISAITVPIWETSPFRS